MKKHIKSLVTDKKAKRQAEKYENIKEKLGSFKYKNYKKHPIMEKRFNTKFSKNNDKLHFSNMRCCCWL